MMQQALFAAARRAGVRSQRLCASQKSSNVERFSSYQPSLGDPEERSSIITQMKTIYSHKVRPVEDYFKFHEFNSPALKDSEFDALPMVMVCGQYSTGKTSFISHLIQQPFPGMHISPEPTTDKFTAVMWGPSELRTPGEALSVMADKPFTTLNNYGSTLREKIEAAQCPAPLLRSLTFVDTPGILSGEKQRIDRGYDFPAVIRWFAERSDCIILLFDSHKLDISDEFKASIRALAGYEDKVKCVLNKADSADGQELMRVYGALMWSLGKILNTPEVTRVYLGSFWDKPVSSRNTFKNLFVAEQRDLLGHLHALPANSLVRKANEFIKRVRQVKVHAYVITHIQQQLPSLFTFNRQAKQMELLDNLPREWQALAATHPFLHGDLPSVEHFRAKLLKTDLSKLPSFNSKMIKQLDDVLDNSIPPLLQRVSEFSMQQGQLRQQLLSEETARALRTDEPPQPEAM